VGKEKCCQGLGLTSPLPSKSLSVSKSSLGGGGPTRHPESFFLGAQKRVLP
jgi:hypothetical protein